jgi:hypothetical protein
MEQAEIQQGKCDKRAIRLGTIHIKKKQEEFSLTVNSK